MPPKIRELVADLERAGFRNRGGRGSHRNYIHTDSGARVTVSGNLGDDADRYKVHKVRRAIEESKR